ncbi:MAG: TIM barrel protein [Parachlamydiales bacterium]|jgi:sugar phosphate isomerase/epimerase
MKIGVTQWTLDCPCGPESLKRAHTLGFSYIHINAGLPDEQYYLGKKEAIKKYKEMVNRFNVFITAIALNSLEIFGLLVDKNGKIDDYLKEIINSAVDAAEALEVPILYFPSFNKSEIKNIEGRNKTAEILKYACDYVIKKNLTIVTENTLGADENEFLINDVNRNNLRLLLDTQNPILWNHSINQIIDKLHFKLTNQIHIKDGLNNIMGNARLGEGNTNLKTTLENLYQKKYNGLLILENDYSQDASIRIPQDFENLSNILQLTCGKKYARV